ncbi:MAG: Lon protease family protein [Anaerolineae bacterium]|nr:Lon protease family protein [Anaerolineae bacterium]
MRALEMGSDIQGAGFNIFAVGLPDSGRSSLIESFVRERALKQPAQDDWCYVNNFADARQPQALRLPAGRGVTLRSDIHELILACARDIPQAFESEEYRRARDELMSSVKQAQEDEFERLSSQAEKEGFAMAKSPFGFVLLPVRDGKPLTPDEVEKLSEHEMAALQATEGRLQESLKVSLARLRDLVADADSKIKELNTRIATFVITPLVEKLRRKYAEEQTVLAHLDALLQDLVEHSARFQEHENNDKTPPPTANHMGGWLRRYEVNVFVNSAESDHAPVITENNPTYYNLLGRIEHEVTMSGAQTDFTLIRPGALHRANGGYLIIPARDVLSQPFAWEGLKRALRSGSLRIVEPGRDFSLVSTTTLEPEPIPLSVRVVLIGTPLVYYLLSLYDEDFEKLFKIKAEFTTQMPRDSGAEAEYAWFVKSVADQNHLPPFDRGAVARIIEQGARLAGDQQRLSTRLGRINNLILEAAYWAGVEQQTVVSAAAVDRAVEESIFRNNLAEERMLEMLEQGLHMVDVTGSAPGQINALSVAMLGDYAFGHPTRVTASARPGRGGIVDIERQSEMGGHIHTKGVLIIEGYLGAQFGRDRVLALSASLAFEQSYEGVDGDSASAAELIALLSAIAEVPIRQDIAITGSINQHGQIQPIGGVNEKIEGFFSACKTKGLTGTQGVLIPASNARHLMLRREVVAAVAAGQFHIWTFATIDDAIRLLCQQEPGEETEEGKYSEGTFSHAVAQNLDKYAQTIARAAKLAQQSGLTDDN